MVHLAFDDFLSSSIGGGQEEETTAPEIHGVGEGKIAVSRQRVDGHHHVMIYGVPVEILQLDVGEEGRGNAETRRIRDLELVSAFDIKRVD